MYGNFYATCLTSLILQRKFADAGTNNVNLEETGLRFVWLSSNRKWTKKYEMFTLACCTTFCIIEVYLILFLASLKSTF